MPIDQDHLINLQNNDVFWLLDIAQGYFSNDERMTHQIPPRMQILETNWTSQVPTMYNLGVKIRNLKVNFKTSGTWRLVGQ